jgi:hypothetical protein
MGMIIAVMLHGEELEVRDFLNLKKFLQVDNASISLCEYTNHKTCAYMNHKMWKLMTWNDCAHLECLAELSAPGGDYECVGLRGA